MISSPKSKARQPCTLAQQHMLAADSPTVESLANQVLLLFRRMSSASSTSCQTHMSNAGQHSGGMCRHFVLKGNRWIVGIARQREGREATCCASVSAASRQLRAAEWRLPAAQPSITEEGCRRRELAVAACLRHMWRCDLDRYVSRCLMGRGGTPTIDAGDRDCGRRTRCGSYGRRGGSGCDRRRDVT